MLANVIYCNNPLDPVNDRELVTIHRKRRIETLAPKTNLPFIAVLNGKPVLRENKGWRQCVKNGDTLVFVTMPLGGGGGSNPLKLALVVALSFAAPGLGTMLSEGMFGLAAPVFDVLGSTITMGQIFGAAISFVGSSLINALIPNQTPAAYNKGSFSISTPSPTYNLNAQGNSARLQEPIPVIYGRHLVYPDFAAEPYTEYSGNEQYLYQLFSVGMGQYSIEKMMIEDTPVDQFEEVAYEIIQPGGSVTLFPTNVVTATEVSGQELVSYRGGSFSVSGTSATINLTGHGQNSGNALYLNFSGVIPDGVYKVISAPTPDQFTIALGGSYSGSGNVTIYFIAGMFTVNGATTQINQVAIDIVLPQGLFYANDDGGLDARSVSWSAYARQIDDDGNAVGGYMTLGNETFTAATSTPQRKTYRYDVPLGRYQVGIARTNAKDTSSRAGSTINFASARGYIPGNQVYQSTMVAMRIRASNNISSTASRRFNCVVNRMLPIYQNGQWTQPQATRSIAWAVADMLRANYGGGAKDVRIDLRKLVKLDKIWAARGESFDAVVDSRMTVWDAITAALRLGRTRPFFQGGVVRFVRDQQETLPVAMFNMRNIVKGTLKTQYILNDEDTADSVVVEYFDETTWKPAEVTASLPGSDTANPARVKLFGCTNRTRAWKEGMYMAAANRYRRQMITFDTEMEGFIPALGDLIAISHDRPNWGKGGEILGESEASNLLRYSEQFDNGTWSDINVIVNDDAMTAPNGQASADMIVVTSTNGNHMISQAANVLSDNQTFSASVYVNSGDMNRLFMSFVTKDGQEAKFEYRFEDGRVTSTASGGQNPVFGIEALSLGWYRMKIEGMSAQSGSTSPLLRIGAARNPSAADAIWTQSGIIATEGVITSPADNWTADLLAETIATGRHYETTILNLIAGKRVAVEAYLRGIFGAPTRWAGILLNGAAFGANQGALIDLNTGVISYQTGGAVNAISVSDVGNGWYKLVIELTPTVTGTASLQSVLSNVSNDLAASYAGDVTAGIYIVSPYVYWTIPDNSVGPFASTAQYFAGDGVSGFYVWGAQIEANATVGQYVQTTTSGATAHVLTLSEPVTFDAGVNNYIALRNTDGSVAGPFLTQQTAESEYEVIISDLAGFTPYYGHEKEKTYFAFGPGQEYSRLAKVVSVKPKSPETVEINAINEDAAVHTADTSGNPPASVYWNLPSKISRPSVSGVYVNFAGTSTAPTFDIGWLPAAGTDKYLVEITFDNGVTWKRLGEAYTNHFTTPAHHGQISIRIAAQSEFAVGDWSYWTGDPYSAPPPDLKIFEVVAQPDGTRQFTWEFDGNTPPDIAGYKIRYRLGVDSDWVWDDLYEMHSGLLNVAPFESNQLSSGAYTFAIKAFDDSGHESVNATFVDANLPDPRLSGVIFQARPNTEGWPGTKTDCFVQPEYNVLAANDTKTWADFPTWADYTRWIQNPVTTMVYEYGPIDVGYIVGFKPLVTATGSGIQVIEESHSDDGVTWTSYDSLVGQVVTRFIKIRISITGDTPRLTSMDIKLDGFAQSEDINDLDTSALTGVYRIGTGDFRVPLRKTYKTISQVQVSLQNVGAGWSWTIVDKDATVGPRVNIYDATGTLANAVVDLYVRGF